MQSIIESLRKQRVQLLEDAGEDVFSRHTSLLDIAIISLYNRLVNRLGQDGELFRTSGAVAGLGFYARGLLSPSGTVQLLFIETDRCPGRGTWHEEITLPLVEAGWPVDIQQGTIETLLQDARENFPRLLTLLGARYISGSRGLAEQLDKALADRIENNREALLRALFAGSEARRRLQSGPERWLEPDLMENPGGLADIRTIRAACRIAADARSLEDAIFLGYLQRREVDVLINAEKSYARLVSILHAFDDDDAPLLRFEKQEAIADKMGYESRAGFLPVESFMQQVQQLLHDVSTVSEEFWARLCEAFWEMAGEGETLPVSVHYGEGLEARAGKLMVTPAAYPQTAAHVVHIFALAAQQRLRLGSVTKQWIQHHRNVLDTAAGDPLVCGELRELLMADGADLPMVRSFYQQGLFTALIPELAAVHALVQHDAFHAYPVHEHHLRTLSELKRLVAGEYTDEEAEITEVARAQEAPVALFFAGLLHDIGKSAGREHALHGGEMIPAIARRLGLSPQQSDDIQFLVAQHLLLLDNASLRDLADEEMLARCTLQVGTLERLELLLLLSFALMRATGPKAIDKWRAAPVVQLYEKIRDLLEKGEPSPRAIAERIEQLRALVGQRLRDYIDPGELEKHFVQLSPRYLLSVHPSAIARHLLMERQLREAGERYVWEVQSTGTAAEITIVTWDLPDILSRAAGTLTLYDFSINAAQIFAKKDGVVLLVFQCRRPEDFPKAPDWEALRRDMRRSLEGKLALDYRIASHAVRRGHRRETLRPVPSRVQIDNESSQDYSILEVYATDRVGLLYTITRTLSDLHVRIHVAKITTRIDQAADVFYIKTAQGEKVTEGEQLDEIRNALLFWLDGTLS
jgi:[protein-PII] uridylyltransferase